MKRSLHPYTRPSALPVKSKFITEQVKTFLEPPYFLSENSNKGNVYFHYTNEAGMQGIRRDNAINASNKNEHGQPAGLCRIYLTDIAPELMRQNSARYAPLIFGNALYQSWQNKIRYCYVLNLSGLSPEKGDGEHIFYLKDIPFLPIHYRLNGQLINRVIARKNVATGLVI